MTLSARHVVILSLERDRLRLAAGTTSSTGIAITAAAAVAFDNDRSLDRPEALGRAVREALATAGAHARTAVACLSCRDVPVASKTFPPAPPDALADMMRLEARRAFVTDLDQLAIDAADGLGDHGDAPRLLAAVKRSTTEALHAVCRAAGLKLAGISVAKATLATAADTGDALGFVVRIAPDHAEIAVRVRNGLRTLRHAPLHGEPGRDDWLDALRSALGRVRLGLNDAGDGPAPVTIFDAAGLTAPQHDTLADRLGAAWTVTFTGAEPLGLSAAPGVTEKDFAEVAHAATAALPVFRRRAWPLDFLNSRLAPRKIHSTRRPVVRIAAAVAIVAAIAIGVTIDLGRRRRELARIEAQLAEVKPEMERTQALADRVTTAGRWTERRPMFLDPILRVSRTLPRESRLWITGLAMREDRRVVLTGRSADETAVLELLDLLRGESGVSGTKLLYLRQSGGSRSEAAFSMMFDTR